MIEDLSPTVPPDDLRIDIQKAEDVRHWAAKFHVTPERLKRAVEKAGPLVKDVQAELART
jgi:hypothetical protein